MSSVVRLIPLARTDMKPSALYTRPASGPHRPETILATGLHKARRSSMVVSVASLSVAEAARLLGVGVARVHQRIADGSLRAERIGSQWVVDELSVLQIAERRSGGRPLSARSAWALIARAERDEAALAALAPVERGRAESRLAQLFALVSAPPGSEDDLRQVAATLRSQLRNRAVRRLYRASGADLPELGGDRRWVPAGLSAPASGIGAGKIAEGYVAEADVARLCADYLLVPTQREGNVVMHVVPDGQKVYADSRLLLAADLVEHRGPREELRAGELLHESAAIYRGQQR